MAHTVKIVSINQAADHVRELVVEKPEGYEFKPGQATELSINKPGWADQRRPFTFTSLNAQDRLEFTIKIYPEHDGVTEQVGRLSVGDELLIRDSWGAIQYKGPGVFIAGGAGVTPFIAILRRLERDGELDGNTLLFSNKRAAGVINGPEFARMLGDRAVFTLTDERAEGYEHGRIDRAFIERYVQDFSQKFYVCGPPEMVEQTQGVLQGLGADTESVVIEE